VVTSGHDVARNEPDLVQRQILQVVKAAGLGLIHESRCLGQSRQTSGSLLIAQDPQPQRVQSQLGHGHVGPEKAKEQVTDLLLVVEVGRLELWPASSSVAW
jgi:hypothetical protein